LDFAGRSGRLRFRRHLLGDPNLYNVGHVSKFIDAYYSKVHRHLAPHMGELLEGACASKLCITPTPDLRSNFGSLETIDENVPST